MSREENSEIGTNVEAPPSGFSDQPVVEQSLPVDSRQWCVVGRDAGEVSAESYLPPAVPAVGWPDQARQRRQDRRYRLW
jgi:hypothetical protein